MFVISAATLLLLASSAFSLPAKRETIRVEGGKREGSYIIKLKDGAKKSDVRQWLDQYLASGSSMTFDYDDDYFNGFSGTFSPEAIDALNGSADIEWVSEDGIHKALVTQNDAPWGLQRISSPRKIKSKDPLALDFKYEFDEKAGEGVDVFVLDTGIFVEHSEFEGRASWGFSAFGDETDGHGHGTHCAGTIAGHQFGVAKKANLIAVKVLNDEGSGSTSGIVAGINYVIKRCRKSDRPCVISMSLGGGIDRSLDNAVEKAVGKGVHVVVAAGNSNVDAKDTSPARAKNVITVGASSIDDVRAPFSNFGPIVDIFAPGVDITSSFIGGKHKTAVLSGTSMATPHVAGAAAYLLSSYGQQTPAELTEKIKALVLHDKLSDIPESTTNTLLQID